MERLALVADTHSYQADFPALLAFIKDQELRHLACLGDCPPERSSSFTVNSPQNNISQCRSYLSGADAIFVAGCLEGECDYLTGNIQAKKRVNK